MVYYVLGLHSALCCQMKTQLVVAVNGRGNPDRAKVAIPRHLIGVLHEGVNDRSTVFGLNYVKLQFGCKCPITNDQSGREDPICFATIDAMDQLYPLPMNGSVSGFI